MTRRTGRLTCAGLMACCAGAAGGQDRPWDERAFLGLSVRDGPGGPVVGWIHPGPLEGRGFTSGSGIRRGDNLVAVDGAGTDAAGLRELVGAARPGDELALGFRRSPEAEAGGAIARGGEGGEEFEVRVVLADRDTWSGTIGRGLGGREIAEPDEGEFEGLILDLAGELGVRDADGGLDELLPYLWGIQEAALDPNALPTVVRAFRRPLSLDEAARPIAERARAAASGQIGDACGLIGHVLDVQFDAPAGTAGPDWGALERLRAELPDGYIADAKRLVRRMRDSVYIFDDHAESHIAVIRQSPEIVERFVRVSLEQMAATHAWVERVGREHAESDPIPRAELPEAVRAAVAGDVLHYELDRDGLVRLVVGGPGANEYDMSRIACVYDVGGDDVYRWMSPAPDGPAHREARARPAGQVVIDLGGNDRYEAEGDFRGPGTGVFGFSILDDRGGDDLYRSSGQFSLGAGLFGVGVILDHGGDDRFQNTGTAGGWSMGAGFYGAGLVVSGGGNDAFLGELLVQGVGGPRGLGAIVNAAGNDLYRANGPHFPSVYGTPGVFATKGQGFGYGVRGYAAGGVGAIYDLGGDDRYEGGEFAQAGGYYFGMGIIHDSAGNDLYYGNRYGQAFAAHQAVGLLIDEAGDDTYWSMTAASQSGAWDQSITMLIDHGGNDTYRCDGLGQGAAAHQSIAVLLDLGGDDRYRGRGRSVQGLGGSNEYHHAASGIYSFSALIDLGGRDVYSSGRSDGQRTRTGSANEPDPARSTLHGIFVDK